MKLQVALILIGPVLLAAIVFQFLPLITRRGIYFSATVDPGFPESEQGRRLLNTYRIQAALWAIAACVVVAILLPANPALAAVAPTLLVGGTGLSYWLKFREVHKLYGRQAPEIRAAELSPPARRKSLSLWLCAPPFGWLAIVAAYVQLHWGRIPEKFPVHWGADGQPNGWASRTFTGVYGPLLLAAFLDVFFLLSAWALVRISRNTTMRHVTVTISLLMMYPISFSFGMVALLPLREFPLWLVPAITLATVAVLIVWSIRVITSPDASDAVPEPQSDRYWKAGVFYYNPDDPAIFVSKRVGIGYTMNFANRTAWLVMVGILLLVLLPALLLRPR